ncbi:MAG TPA: hypothetical protein VM186_12770 [Planctomycetota bacterium]|nr:hypothetical protein [Planctomycetota bacterium]
MSRIEADLGLPEPIETEAPASDWPHWKYRYLTDNAMVFFHAEPRRPHSERDFVYIGYSHVEPKDDYYDALRRLNSAGRTEVPP